MAVLAVLYLVALWSTHATLSGGSVYWSGSAQGKAGGLGPITGAERASTHIQGDYGQVLWASRPGSEVTFGFELHNGGIVPVTVLSLRPLGLLPGAIHDLAPVSALLGPDKFGRLTSFHPVALGPGDSVAVGLTERVVCDPTVRQRRHGGAAPRRPIVAGRRHQPGHRALPGARPARVPDDQPDLAGAGRHAVPRLHLTSAAGHRQASIRPT